MVLKMKRETGPLKWKELKKKTPSFKRYYRAQWARPLENHICQKNHFKITLNFETNIFCLNNYGFLKYFPLGSWVLAHTYAIEYLELTMLQKLSKCEVKA